MTEIYALDNSATGGKIIHHDKHEGEKENKEPGPLCLRPFEPCLTVVEGRAKEAK